MTKNTTNLTIKTTIQTENTTNLTIKTTIQTENTIQSGLLYFQSALM
jgi:hypothetical protein